MAHLQHVDVLTLHLSLPQIIPTLLDFLSLKSYTLSLIARVSSSELVIQICGIFEDSLNCSLYNIL